MTPGLHRHMFLVVGSFLVLGSYTTCLADQSQASDQLTLADLTAYRTALAGKAITRGAGASVPPAVVSFKQLWSRPDAYRGRRVTVEGRVERIFRQGPVGSFPALAEIWIASPASDPFCLVMPQDSSKGVLPAQNLGLEDTPRSKPIPERGQAVRFTGTFLKMVRYESGDGARLAPLIVGDRPPVPASKTGPEHSGGPHPNDELKQWTDRSASWISGLTLALLATGVLAWRYLHLPSARAIRRKQRHGERAFMSTDPPLEFIEPHDQS